MMAKDNGGPAFPGKALLKTIPSISVIDGEKVEGKSEVFHHPAGMTLLDYFAAQAVAGMIGTALEGAAKMAIESAKAQEITVKACAVAAYQAAEAMIAEKRRREE